MRTEKHLQTSLFDSFVEHQQIDALKAISEQLDQIPDVISWVAKDVCTGQRNTGPEGLSAESALRIALLMRSLNLSYQRVAFHLCDSSSMRAFARLLGGQYPKKSAIHNVVSAISASTWERINEGIVRRAAQCKVERGRKVRIDSTVSAAHIEAPTDSRLLCKSIQTMLRLLKRGSQWVEVRYRDCHRAATQRQMAIQYGRGKVQREKAYRQLIKLTRTTQASLLSMSEKVTTDRRDTIAWQAQVAHYMPLIAQVIDQTTRRVLHGESVPADDKLVSLCEPHVDIICKGGRDTFYGHKINLVTGASAMILDLVIERGNPADSARFIPMIERQCQRYGRPPRQIAADGGYASRDNLDQARQLGVKDVVFSKRKNLKVEEMAKSRWVYRQLRKFRANVEAQIANLKNLFGAKRVHRHGWDNFCAYIQSATVAYNLHTLVARLAIP